MVHIVDIKSIDQRFFGTIYIQTVYDILISNKIPLKMQILNTRDKNSLDSI